MDKPLAVAEARLGLAAVRGRWEQRLVPLLEPAGTVPLTVPFFWCSANVPLPWRRQLGQPGCVSGCAGIGQIDRAPLRQPVPLPFGRGRRQQSQRYSPTALLQLPIVCATAAANPTDV